MSACRSKVRPHVHETAGQKMACGNYFLRIVACPMRLRIALHGLHGVQVSKLDAMLLLVDTHLLESRTFFKSEFVTCW